MKDKIFKIEKMLLNKKSEIEKRVKEINTQLKLFREDYPHSNLELNKIEYNQLKSEKEKLEDCYIVLQNISLEIAHIKGY